MANWFTRFFSPQQRDLWSRTSGNLLINDPAQVVWLGSDTWPGVLEHGTGDTVPAVTRLTAIITDPLATSPWRITDATGIPSSTPRWVNDPQLLRPDARFPGSALPAVLRQPAATFWASWIRSAVWTGSGFLAFIEDESGAPLAGTLRVLHPELVAPIREGGATLWQVGSGTDSVTFDREGRVTLGGQTWRIVVLRDPHAPIDQEGRSIGTFERHSDLLNLTTNIDTYASGIYRAGVPSGVLKVNANGLTQAQATDLKQRWMEAHGGDTRSVAVLNASTDFQPLSFSPVDAELVNAKRANLADLCMAFGLDPNGALGISMGNSSTYSNVQQHFQRLRQDLLPWITGVEQTLSALLPAGTSVRMDFSELMRPDPKEHYDALQTAVAAGLMTIDEARAAIGLPPLPAKAEPIEPPVDADPTENPSSSEENTDGT